MKPVLCHLVALERGQADEAAAEILRDLGEYFQLAVIGSSVWVGVDRGVCNEAPLRVATVLDSIDQRWDLHLELRTILAEVSA